MSNKSDNAEPVFQAHRKRFGYRTSYLLLIGLSTLVAFASCELLLRLFWHNPYRYETPHRVLKLPLNHAQTDHIFDRSAIDRERPTVRFRTDSRSYVMPSRRFEYPDMTIAFLGGSTTECVAVQEELRFPAAVSFLLEKKGLKVNSLNAAKSGNTTHDAINVLFNHVIQDNADVVVLMEAWNDIGFLKEYASYIQQMSGTENFSDLLRFILSKGSSFSHFIALFRKWATYGRLTIDYGGDHARDSKEIPPAEYEKRLRLFVRGSRAFGIQPIVMTQPGANIRNALTPLWGDLKNQEAFNDIVRKVGRNEGVVVIDLARHLVENIKDWDAPMNIFYDGVHVTDRGSLVYAEHIAQRLYDDVFVSHLSKSRSGQNR